MEKGSGRLQKTSKLSADEIGKGGSKTVYVWEGTPKLIVSLHIWSLVYAWPQGNSDFNAQMLSEILSGFHFCIF
jgi:hypothetical protein